MRTSLYSILCIVVRMGAVWLAVSVVVGLPTTAQLLHASDPGLAGWAAVAECLALVLATALWLYPGLVARIAAGRSSQQVFESPIEAADLQAIALAVLGAGFAMSGLVALVTHGMHYVWMTRLSDVYTPMAARGVFSILADGVQVALGVALALGARGLNALLLRVRGRGPLPAETADPGEAP